MIRYMSVYHTHYVISFNINYSHTHFGLRVDVCVCVCGGAQAVAQSTEILDTHHTHHIARNRGVSNPRCRAQLATMLAAFGIQATRRAKQIKFLKNIAARFVYMALRRPRNAIETILLSRDVFARAI